MAIGGRAMARVAAVRIRAPFMLGRDGDLDSLGRLVAGARSGRGCAVFVAGEPGIGKSRLVREVVAGAAAAGVVVLFGRGSAIGPMVPFRPIVEALLSLSRAGRVPGGEQLGPYRDILGRLVPRERRRVAGRAR